MILSHGSLAIDADIFYEYGLCLFELASLNSKQLMNNF